MYFLESYCLVLIPLLSCDGICTTLNYIGESYECKQLLLYCSRSIPSLTLLQNSQNYLAHIFHKNSISKCKAGYFEPKFNICISKGLWGNRQNTPNPFLLKEDFLKSLITF